MRLFGAAERSGGDSPGCGYRQMFWLVMTVYHYGLILPTPTGWRGVELRGRVQGGVFRDGLGMHPRWSQAPSQCVCSVWRSRLFVRFGSDVDRLSSVVLVVVGTIHRTFLSRDSEQYRKMSHNA